MIPEIAGLRPKPNEWFLPKVEYAGRGVAVFSDPPGEIAGHVQISSDASDMSIEMEAEELDTSDSDMLLLMFLRPGNGNPCARLEVATPEGIFVASEDIRVNWTLGDDTAQFRFWANVSQFDAYTDNEPEYWVLPLTNFVSRFAQHRTELDRHPLRIYPTPIIPDDLKQNWLAEPVANEKNLLIVFSFNEAPGFIEGLPDYKDREARLTSQHASSCITAVMVGEVGAKPTARFEDVRHWFPFDFLHLLGLATGSEVGAPWIEFRDSQGKLVRRMHVRLSTPIYAKGHRSIDEAIHRGTGDLLTTAQSSSHWDRSQLRVTLRHLVRSLRYTNTMLEDRFGYACRALETLCTCHDLSVQDLQHSLSSAERSSVQSALKAAAQCIHNLGSAAAAKGRHVQGRALNRIAERTLSSPTCTDRSFGFKVVELLKQYGLADADIVDTYYLANPRPDGRRTWASVLSYYRGAVLHEGFFDVSSTYDVRDIMTVTTHLQDVLIRTLLKMVGYSGEYEPVVGPPVTRECTDWVTPATEPARLGYE